MNQAAVGYGPNQEKDIDMAVDDTSISDEALHHLIAVRAYELWENHGRPHGYELLNWRQAEQEILSSIDNGQRAAPDADT